MNNQPIKLAYLRARKARSDYYFEAKGCGSPITLLQGPKTKEATEKAAQLTAYHSDQKTGIVQVKFGKEKLERQIFVNIPTKEEVEK